VVGMTASSPEEIAAAKNNLDWHLTSIFCNNCKTIERANQVLFYSKGTIVQKSTS
jgi:hypothetical protein